MSDVTITITWDDWYQLSPEMREKVEVYGVGKWTTATGVCFIVDSGRLWEFGETKAAQSPKGVEPK